MVSLTSFTQHLPKSSILLQEGKLAHTKNGMQGLQHE